MLGAVQFYTGQWFEMETITKAAQAKGSTVFNFSYHESHRIVFLCVVGGRVLRWVGLRARSGECPPPGLSLHFSPSFFVVVAFVFLLAWFLYFTCS